MEFVHHIFDADQWLWIVWLMAIISAAACGRQLFQRLRLRRLWRLHKDESGAGYTMGVVLTLPLFLLLCGMALEVTFLIIAKMGVVYAAYAGARATAVWEMMPGELAQRRIDQAVISGMAPFAASLGFDPEASDPARSLPSYANDLADNYYQAVQKSAEPERLDQHDMQDHFLRVFRRIESRATVSERRHGAEIIMKVRYSAPLIVPGVAVFLDEDHRSPWEYPLTAEVRMTLEGPKSRNGTLGIDYRPY